MERYLDEQLIQNIKNNNCNAYDFSRLKNRYHHNKEIQTVVSETVTIKIDNPNIIHFFENLQYLDLSGCSNLTSLPIQIGQLTNLKELDLSGCFNLTSLPTQIGQLTNLEKLDLSGCFKLHPLPIEIGQLTRFYEIYYIIINT